MARTKGEPENKQANPTAVMEFLHPQNSGSLGVTSKEVGEEFDITRSRAHQILQDLESDQMVWSAKRGQARLWYPMEFEVDVEANYQGDELVTTVSSAFLSPVETQFDTFFEIILAGSILFGYTVLGIGNHLGFSLAEFVIQFFIIALAVIVGNMIGDRLRERRGDKIS